MEAITDSSLPLGPRQPQVLAASAGLVDYGTGQPWGQSRVAGGCRTSEAEHVAADPSSGALYLQSHVLPCPGDSMPMLGHPRALSPFLRAGSLSSGARWPGFSSWAWHLLPG